MNYQVFSSYGGSCIAAFDYLDDAKDFCSMQMKKLPKQPIKIIGPLGSVVAVYPKEQ